VEASGLYEVFISIDGCNYSGEYEYSITALEDVKANLQLYPNPVVDELTIILPDSLPAGQVVVTNLLGQVCASQEIFTKGKIDFSNLAAGITSPSQIPTGG
jgi:hypothetical protein